MKAVQARVEADEERAADRYAVAIDTVMRELGQQNVPIRIDNISTQGFGGACAERFSRPCVVAVALPGAGDVKARVVWTEDGTLGGEFLVPLDLSSLDCKLGAITRSAV